MDITIILKSGGTVFLRNAFIAGNGVAGDISDGTTRRFSDDDIVEIKVHAKA